MKERICFLFKMIIKNSMIVALIRRLFFKKKLYGIIACFCEVSYISNRCKQGMVNVVFFFRMQIK